MGKEGSVRTHAIHDTRMLHASHVVTNGNGDDMRLDVHYCTSALCPICNGGGTRFVSAVNSNTDERRPPLWCWRVTNMPLRVQAARVASSTSRGMGGVGTVVHQSGQNRRTPYIVDHTIDF